MKQQQQQQQQATQKQQAINSLRNYVAIHSPEVSDSLITQSALVGRDGTQRCVGCGEPTRMDNLVYVTPDPLEPCEFYCKSCKEELSCVDPFAKRNY
jgi:hypothetical protein